MAALYDRYAGLFLHTNAAFLCERAHAEAPSSQTLEALASCYLRQGAAHRAYATLRGQTLEPHGRYLLALACQRLDKDAESEAALAALYPAAKPGRTPGDRSPPLGEPAVSKL